MNDFDPAQNTGDQDHHALPPIETLPELTSFLDADVSSSPEAQQQEGGASAGEMEYARTKVAVEVYDRLYGDPNQDEDPDYVTQDYAWVIEAQHIGHGEDRKLRPGYLQSEEFLLRRQELRESFPDKEAWDATRYVTAIHDIMKNDENLVAVGLTPGVDSHDDGLPRLFMPEYTEQRAQILPTFADPNQFTNRQREIIEGASTVRGVNWPGILQSQAPAVMLENMPQNLDAQTLEAFIVHAEADIAGAAGHINPNGSLTMDSPTFQRMRMLRQAVRQGGTSGEISNAYLDGCAKTIYGIEADSLNDSALNKNRAMTRIANALRVPDANKYTQVIAAFDSQPEKAREIITLELNRTGIDDRAPDLDFLPAMLIGLEKSHGLSKTVEYLASILQAAAIADRQESNNHPTAGVFEVKLESLAKAAQNRTLDTQKSIHFISHEGALFPAFAE